MRYIHIIQKDRKKIRDLYTSWDKSVCLSADILQKSAERNINVYSGAEKAYLSTPYPQLEKTCKSMFYEWL
jgi:hypothetical protein